MDENSEEESSSPKSATDCPPNPILERNIKCLIEERDREMSSRSLHDLVADAITSSFGSLAFLYAHIVWFAVWILWNTAASSTEVFDPFPFTILTSIVSLEAIFLSTLVLISENRARQLDERRADLDLHINLLAEKEVTEVLKMLNTLLCHLNVPYVSKSEDVNVLEEEISPANVWRTLGESESRSHKQK